MIATLQATEVIKVLLDMGDVYSGKLLIYNALKMSFRELNVTKRNNYHIRELIDYNQFCGINKQEENQMVQKFQFKSLNKK